MTTSNRKFIRARIAGLIVGIGVLGIPIADARAQSAAEMETARDLFKDGKSLRDAGNLRGALAKFKAAHSLGNTPITGLELGKTHLALGELLEAREVLLSVERIPEKAAESTSAKDARAESAKLAEEAKVRIPSITIAVSGLAAGATANVTVDGTIVKQAALSVPLKLNPGKHAIVARSGDGPETRSDVVLKEGESKAVPIAVAASTAAPAPARSSDAPALPAATTPAAAAPLTDEEQAAHDETEAKTGGVHLHLVSPKDDERWTLRFRNGKLLCTLPCDRWMGTTGGYYVQKEDAPVSSSTRIVVPQKFDYSVGSNLVATPGSRGSVTGAVIGLVVSGITSLVGITIIAGGRSPCVFHAPSASDERPNGQDSGTCTAAWIAFVGGAAAFAASDVWYIWSHGPRLSTEPASASAGASAASTTKLRWSLTGMSGIF